MPTAKPFLRRTSRFGLVAVLVSLFVLLPQSVMAGAEYDARQDDLTDSPTDGPKLLAEVVVMDDGSFELYSLHGLDGEPVLITTLTPEDIDAAKALAISLGQGVQIVPLGDEVASAQLALRLPQVFAVSADQCALMADYPDGRTGTQFFVC